MQCCQRLGFYPNIRIFEHQFCFISICKLGILLYRLVCVGCIGEVHSTVHITCIGYLLPHKQYCSLLYNNNIIAYTHLVWYEASKVSNRENMISYSLFALLIGSLLQLGCCIEGELTTPNYWYIYLLYT